MMLAWLQSLHGYLAVLAVAACAHPAVTLRGDRPPSARVRLSVWFATSMSAAGVALGWWLYPDYGELVKPWLLEHHPWLHRFGFEAKEALGFFSLVGAVAGGGLVLLAPDEPVARQGARTAFVLATVAGVLAAVLGVAVVVYRDLLD